MRAQGPLIFYPSILLLTFAALTGDQAEAFPVLFSAPAAIGGLITGIIGAVLNALSLGVQAGALTASMGEEEEEGMEGEGGTREGNMMMMYGRNEMMEMEMMKKKGMNMQHMRGKRSTSNSIKEKAEEVKLRVESMTDNLYKNDRSQCIEKMVCDITKKAVEKGVLTDVEENILKLMEWNENHGVTYKKMVVAHKVGLTANGCDYLFSTCPIETSQMLNFVTAALRSLQAAA